METNKKRKFSRNPKVLAKRAAKDVADWNAKYPFGAVVRYWKGVRQGEPSGQGSTRSPAEVQSDTAVIFVEGCSGSVALSHVEVVT